MIHVLGGDMSGKNSTQGSRRQRHPRRQQQQQQQQRRASEHRKSSGQPKIAGAPWGTKAGAITYEEMAYAIVGVSGFIGAGKTTLLANSKRNHNIPVFAEYVPDRLLGDYISGEKPAALMNGYHFQIAMMLASCTRQRSALSVAHTVGQHIGAIRRVASQRKRDNLLRDNVQSHRVVLVERPPLENRVFALANFLCGKLSASEYANYLGYIGEIIDASGFPDVPQHNVVLWSRTDVSYNNMLDRGNEHEADYDADVYLSCLHHSYFLDFLHGHLEGYNRRTTVMDWNAYGEYSDCAAGISRDLATPLAVYYSPEQFPGDATESPVVRVEQSVHLDFSAYMRRDSRARTVCQDAVFACISRQPGDRPHRQVDRLVVHGFERELSLYGTPCPYASDRTYLASSDPK